jgi:two-component system phosphate regulon sensor histidine kinase PhoR
MLFSDSTGRGFYPAGPFPVMYSDVSPNEWEHMLRRNRWKLERLPRYLRTGYRKLEPLFLGDSTSPRSRVLLVFALGDNARFALMGIMLDEQQFINRVIARKLTDVAGNNFILGVLSKNSSRIIFSTSETKHEELRQQKTLWLFPGYELGIRLKGTTIDELTQSRTKRNLILILLMDVVLLAGAWLVYTSIRREMELVRIKSDFVSNVSHELRTPLALIRMFGETLEMGRVKSDEKKQEYYGTIVKESERLTRLVNNILDFSKMEAGKKQYNFQKVDINAIISSVMNTYSYHLYSEGFLPVLELSSSLPQIKADSEAVTEAIINLIDNAIKFSETEKFLRLRTFVRDSIVAVEVEDHGVGIAQEHKKRIFDTFYRVGAALVHNTKGTGLGLSLVKHIMDAHGGLVNVDSVVGKGSTFRLLFPLNV